MPYCTRNTADNRQRRLLAPLAHCEYRARSKRVGQVCLLEVERATKKVFGTAVVVQRLKPRPCERKADGTPA